LLAAGKEFCTFFVGKVELFRKWRATFGERVFLAIGGQL
jgi:hypothetical protein